jgi:hypothetical protein
MDKLWEKLSRAGWAKMAQGFHSAQSQPMHNVNWEPVWYSFMSGFTSSFTTSIAKWPALCPALWPASLKTLSHRVKHVVKLQKHSSPLLMKLLMKLFSKKQIYWWSWAMPNRAWDEFVLDLLNKNSLYLAACSVGWWLMAGAGLFWEKSTAGWLRLVAGGWFVLREKYYWLVADKPSEQAVAIKALSPLFWRW